MEVTQIVRHKFTVEFPVIDYLKPPSDNPCLRGKEAALCCDGICCEKCIFNREVYRLVRAEETK